MKSDKRIKGYSQTRKSKDKSKNRTDFENTTKMTVNSNADFKPVNRGMASYESLKNLTNEINHVKDFCKELKKTHDENCIMQNEKKNFEKMSKG